MAESFQLAADRIGLKIGAKPDPALELPERIEETLAGMPDGVFYAGEEAPYVNTEVFFSALRERGYEGPLVTVDVDPEVSFLAFPSRFPPGTLFDLDDLSAFRRVRAKYEPATDGRRAPMPGRGTWR